MRESKNYFKGHKKDLAMKQSRMILKRIWHKVLFILFTAFIITGLNSLSVNAITLQEKCQEYKNKGGQNIHLNKATEKELEYLPGIGIKTARAIVNHRKSINGFKSLEQLRLVRGIGDETYNCLKDFVAVSD
ncbi:MAG: helix-hairpin-helix domain-containing protein [Nitrospirae bacterium]|nr:helix-hairpin-helix domain-containing protein [Nitrospirota bacterium]